MPASAALSSADTKTGRTKIQIGLPADLYARFTELKAANPHLSESALGAQLILRGIEASDVKPSPASV